jgi:hypothetical protein
MGSTSVRVSIQVAGQEAGVSHCIVSQELRRSPLISGETGGRRGGLSSRADGAGSTIAHALGTLNTRSIGVVVAMVSDDPLAFVSGVEELTVDHRYINFLCDGNSSLQNESYDIHIPLENRLRWAFRPLLSHCGGFPNVIRPTACSIFGLLPLVMAPCPQDNAMKGIVLRGAARCRIRLTAK